MNELYRLLRECVLLLYTFLVIIVVIKTLLPRYLLLLFKDLSANSPSLVRTWRTMWRRAEHALGVRVGGVSPMSLWNIVRKILAGDSEAMGHRGI